MAKVESFDLDHTKVKAPYIRVADVKYYPGDESKMITKFDLRFIQPNRDHMTLSAAHSLEHLLATYMRDHIDNMIDLSPMGCMTGFYATFFGQPSVAEVRDALVTTLQEIADGKHQVPATDEKSCGYYKNHSLFGAIEYAKQVLKQQFSLDPFERQL